MTDKNSPPFKDGWKSNERVIRLEALERLSQLGCLLVLALFYTVVLSMVLLFIVLLPSVLAFLLGIIDNLILKFIFGFRKTWLSEAIKSLTNLADGTLEGWIKY